MGAGERGVDGGAILEVKEYKRINLKRKKVVNYFKIIQDIVYCFHDKKQK